MAHSQELTVVPVVNHRGITALRVECAPMERLAVGINAATRDPDVRQIADAFPRMRTTVVVAGGVPAAQCAGRLLRTLARYDAVSSNA